MRKVNKGSYAQQRRRRLAHSQNRTKQKSCDPSPSRVRYIWSKEQTSWQLLKPAKTYTLEPEVVGPEIENAIHIMKPTERIEMKEPEAKGNLCSEVFPAGELHRDIM